MQLAANLPPEPGVSATSEHCGARSRPPIDRMSRKPGCSRRSSHRAAEVRVCAVAAWHQLVMYW